MQIYANELCYKLLQVFRVVQLTQLYANDLCFKLLHKEDEFRSAIRQNVAKAKG